MGNNANGDAIPTPATADADKFTIDTSEEGFHKSMTHRLQQCHHRTLPYPYNMDQKKEDMPI